MVLKGALADAVQSHIQLQRNLPFTRESNGPRRSGAAASLLAKLRAEPADHNSDTSTSVASGSTELHAAECLPGVHSVAGLEAEGPVLESLDVRAKHERFQSSIVAKQCYDEASSARTYRTVAARAELTALTPTVERFFGTRTTSGLKYTSS